MPHTTSNSTNPTVIRGILFASITTVIAVIVIAASSSPIHAGESATTQPCDKCACTAGKPSTNLITVIQPTQGNHIAGTAHFTQTENGVHIVADITGLTPNSTHGFHVHQFGDASAANGTSAGGHFNPHGHDHALPEHDKRHAGDLGNITADENGHAHYESTVDNLTLTTGPTAILGRAVIIHAKNDDGGQPTGNAGPRIGIGIIGYEKN